MKARRERGPGRAGRAPASAATGAADGGRSPDGPQRELHAGQEQLREKYAALCRKHEALVESAAAAARERSHAVELAFAVLRHATVAAALVREGAIRVRDRKWLDLLRENPGPWRELDADGAPTEVEHTSCEAAAVAAAAALAPGSTATVCVESPLTARVVELRVVRPGREEPVVAVAFASDVTERSRAGRELQRLRRNLAAQERVRELGVLTAGIAHDLSNAIQGVQLRVDLLRQAPVLPEHAAQLDVLARLAGDAGRRLRRLRELATGAAAGPLGDVALGEAVLEAVEEARAHVERGSRDRNRTVLLQVDLPELLPRVVADPAELRHVLLNLVLNARDAMPDGGVVRVRAMHGGAWGIVTVSDEGTGFAAEHLLRAFEPFFTTKGERGSGLGLSGAAAFMRRVGGYISVENRLDGGARVRLTFQAWRAPVERAPADGAPAEQRGA